MAAALLHCYNNVSKTDVSCTWIQKKKKNDESELKSIDELYPIEFTSSENLEKKNVNNLHKKLILEKNLTCGYTYLFADEPKPTVSSTAIEDSLFLENVIFSSEFGKSDNKRLFLQNTFKLNRNKIESIAAATTGQTSNINWWTLRKYRITASNFNLVLQCSRRGRYPKSLFRTLTSSYNLDGVHAIQWGRTHEKDAIKALELEYNISVKESGLWLHESGVLAASPDGIISKPDGCSDYVVEVKCPYKYKSQDLRTALNKDQSYFIIVHDDGEVIYNDTHPYHDQVQGQLHFSMCTSAIVVIWSTVNHLTVKIDRDPEWAKNIPILTDFFYNIYVPWLLKNQQNL